MPADGYHREVARAIEDHSWETPDRTAARLFKSRLDRSVLEPRGLRLQWAGRDHEGRFTIALELRESGPYQVLVHLPWRQAGPLGEPVPPEEMVGDMMAEIAKPSANWSDVEWSPMGTVTDAPTCAGKAWRPLNPIRTTELRRHMTTDQLIRLAAWVSGAEVVLLSLGAMVTQRISLSAEASTSVVWLTSIIGIIVIPLGCAAVLHARGRPGAIASGVVACGGVVLGGFAWALLGIAFGVATQPSAIVAAWRVIGYAIIVAASIVAIGSATLLKRSTEGQ